MIGDRAIWSREEEGPVAAESVQLLTATRSATGPVWFSGEHPSGHVFGSKAMESGRSQNGCCKDREVGGLAKKMML